MAIMCNLHVMTKSDFLELSQVRKMKHEKPISKKIDVKSDEWVSLSWTCAYNQMITVEK